MDYSILNNLDRGLSRVKSRVSLTLFDDHIYTGTTVSNSICEDPLRNHCRMYGCVVNLLMRGIYDSTRVIRMHFRVESAPSTLPVRLFGTQEINQPRSHFGYTTSLCKHEPFHNISLYVKKNISSNSDIAPPTFHRHSTIQIPPSSGHSVGY